MVIKIYTSFRVDAEAESVLGRIPDSWPAKYPERYSLTNKSKGEKIRARMEKKARVRLAAERNKSLLYLKPSMCSKRRSSNLRVFILRKAEALIIFLIPSVTNSKTSLFVGDFRFLKNRREARTIDSVFFIYKAISKLNRERIFEPPTYAIGNPPRRRRGIPRKYFRFLNLLFFILIS